MNLPHESDIDEQLDQLQERIGTLREECARVRVLSTLPFSKVPFWTECVETLPARRNFLSRLTDRVGIPDITLLFRLLARAHRYDLVLLAGGERVDLFYLALAGLLPFLRTRHVIVDAHWQRSRGLAYLLQKLLLRFGRRLTAQVQPHSTEEIPIYHGLFGVPLDKLHAVPWSTSLIGHDVSPARPDEPGGFVLTGGLSFRDYETLLAAVDGLDLRVEIGLPNQPAAQRIVERGRGLPNVACHTDWSNAQFIRKMAACRVFALPIEPGLTRCTADQTILNAMYFGKVVVATSSIGSRAYIDDGVNGLLVPEKSVTAWRETLQRVYAMPDEKYREIGRRAAHDARALHSEPLRLVRTLEGALAAARSTRG
jgi:glycosyltransferase involved in cell wall biosynthesis